MKILLAEDDSSIAKSIHKHLLEENIETDIALDGQQALAMFNSNRYDLLLLDWRMPKVSGYEICKKIRNENNDIPIILLTALADIKNKLEAFKVGADDYITKPFSIEEVIARIMVADRHNKRKLEYEIIGNIKLDLILHKLFVKNVEIKLTDKEFELIHYFIKNKGLILSKEDLCKNVWNYDFVPESNIIESAIKNLRRKIEVYCEKKMIKNVYGEGYIFIEE